MFHLFKIFDGESAAAGTVQHFFTNRWS
jgi:hypothetical protein